MKCPKCGYNTFEYLDSCKKCGKELASFKESMGIRPLVLQVAAPAVAGLEVAGELLQGSGVLTEAPDDKLFQWDAPEPSTDSGLSEMAEFGVVTAADTGNTAVPSNDPFSFDEEFDIPLSPQQETAPPEVEDPFGGFSLDDLGSVPEETLPDMTQAQEAVEGKPAFEGFAFEDEEISHVVGQVSETPAPLAAADSDDIFGGIVLEEAGGAFEEKVEKELFPEEDPAAENIFGEFSFDEQTSSVAEKPEDDRQLQSGDDIFGEFAFEESTAISSSPELEALGGTGIFDEKEALSVDTGSGEAFPQDAFADDFPDLSGDSLPIAAAGSGEFDLDDFLKIEDEPKVAGSQGEQMVKSSTDDLDALFGELELAEKK